MMGNILIFFLLFFSSNSFAETMLFGEECTSQSDYTYCIYKSKQGNNKDIAYYFHGRGGRPESWGQDKDFALVIQQYWWKNKIKPPVVVSVSFGKEWLLAPKLSLPQSGLFEKFKSAVIPEVESKLFKPEKRIVFGKSMGGLNALIAGLTADGFFKKIAAFCGGVYDFPFYKMSPQITALIKNKTADSNYVEEFIALTSKYVASDEEWKMISPVVLIDKFSDKATDMYIWAGRNDRHPNFEGNKLVADKAKAKKLHVTWVGSDGGHCTGIDPIEVAKFLTR